MVATVKFGLCYLEELCGKLEMKVCSAELEREIDLVGKMDPFVVCVVGAEERVSKTVEGGGKNPIWNS